MANFQIETYVRFLLYLLIVTRIMAVKPTTTTPSIFKIVIVVNSVMVMKMKGSLLNKKKVFHPGKSTSLPCDKNVANIGKFKSKLFFFLKSSFAPS
mmetsp:Transcript_10044/g.11475  ORF Transcript_10044/g.11475 Transcript_10044/m.11475 type:complete len:96 (+) Transcript_10044:210-497(+)